MYSRKSNKRYARSSSSSRRSSRLRTPIIVREQNIPRNISDNIIPINFRFINGSAISSATNIQVYRRSILNLLWLATGSSAGVPLIAGVRINHLKIYLVGLGGDTSSGINVIKFVWNSALGPSRQIVIDGQVASLGVSTLTPPLNSSASFWSNNQSTGAPNNYLSELLFQITGSVPENCLLVDVFCSFVLEDGNTQRTLTTSAASGGVLYANSLDNSSSSGSVGGNTLICDNRSYLNSYG